MDSNRTPDNTKHSNSNSQRIDTSLRDSSSGNHWQRAHSLLRALAMKLSWQVATQSIKHTA